MTMLDATGRLSAAYNSDYMAAALINAVPLMMLGLAELVVIVSGRGGIDLSVGANVSLTGMVFGFGYGLWGWPLPLAIAVALVFGALLGLVNGVLVAYLGFPPLIATLATYYAYLSLALVANGQKPINTAPIQGLYSASGLGAAAPGRAVPAARARRGLPVPPAHRRGGLAPHGSLDLRPGVVRDRHQRRRGPVGRAGRRAAAACWPTSSRARSPGWSAVVTVSQFASARPDAGTSGNGMALPAITIAVLGGVAITGGVGRVLGVFLAALLIVWLNAGLLLAFSGNLSSQIQLLALGVILIAAALLNGVATRRYGGTQQ